MHEKNEILVDQTFGTGKRSATGTFWQSKYKSLMFGRISVSVRCDEVILDSQRNAFNLFKLNEGQIFRDTQEYLFETYKRFRMAVENDPFQSPDDFVSLTTSEQIWGQLEKPFDGGTSLFVLFSRENSTFLKLAWNCTWDIEHGQSVCIENGKVVSRKRSLELQ